jgi:hypothetical protein
MAVYAAQTEVAVHRSKQAIEALLLQHGAKAYTTGWNETHDTLQFRLFESVVRFTLPRPSLKDRRYTHDKRGWLRSNQGRDRAMQQADRQRWRALYLVIRAKIEAVESGIAVFEQEFLAFIVLPNDLTIGDVLVPQIHAGTLSRLLGDGRQSVEAS